MSISSAARQMASFLRPRAVPLPEMHSPCSPSSTAGRPSQVRPHHRTHHLLTLTTQRPSSVSPPRSWSRASALCCTSPSKPSSTRFRLCPPWYSTRRCRCPLWTGTPARCSCARSCRLSCSPARRLPSPTRLGHSSSRPLYVFCCPCVAAPLLMPFIPVCAAPPPLCPVPVPVPVPPQPRS